MVDIRCVTHIYTGQDQIGSLGVLEADIEI